MKTTIDPATFSAFVMRSYFQLQIKPESNHSTFLQKTEKKIWTVNENAEKRNVKNQNDALLKNDLRYAQVETSCVNLPFQWKCVWTDTQICSITADYLKSKEFAEGTVLQALTLNSSHNHD